MPRKYIRKGAKGKWSEGSLKNAMKAIDSGMSKRKAAKTFEIPLTTIHNHCTGE
jgi:hypothetical protein